jgi:hypothetical protein
MKAINIRKLLDPKKRFHPFDVRTGSGGSYRVSSPEMIWISPDGEILILYRPNEGVTMIDVDEVTECHLEIKARKTEKENGE